MEIKFKRGEAVIASPSRGKPFAAFVVRRYETQKGQFVVVREKNTKREVNMRPGMLKLA